MRTGQQLEFKRLLSFVEVMKEHYEQYLCFGAILYRLVLLPGTSNQLSYVENAAQRWKEGTEGGDSPVDSTTVKAPDSSTSSRTIDELINPTLPLFSKRQFVHLNLKLPGPEEPLIHNVRSRCCLSLST